MIRAVTVTLLFGVLFWGCGNSNVTGADTPEALYEKLKNAMGNKDWNTIYDCLQPSVLRQAETDLERKRKELAQDETRLKQAADLYGVKPEEFMKMTYRQVFAKTLQSTVTDKSIKDTKESKVIGKEMNGNICRLKIQGGGEVKFFEMVQEGGKWYWTGTAEK